MEWLAQALHKDPDATRDDLREAETLLQDALPHRRRVFGRTHPKSVFCEDELDFLGKFIASRDSRIQP